MKKPLNGTKTHPLSEHALHALRVLLSQGPQPYSTINPGVSNRLLREDLVEHVNLPSPFATHRGKSIDHLKITAAGRKVLGKLP